MDNNHNRAIRQVHATQRAAYLEQMLRLTCVAILWVATFWCIPYVLGQISTALVVTGRVVAVGIAGVLVLRVRRTEWSLLPLIGHTSVLGLIYAILPMVLFLCVGEIVPRSQTIAATKPPFGINWSPIIQEVAAAALATRTFLIHALRLINGSNIFATFFLMVETLFS
jgi:hypothetical protein